MLLEVDARHAIEEVALQTQGDWSPWWLLDGVACFGHIDALYGLPIELSIGSVDAEVGNQPTRLLSATGDNNGPPHGRLPDRRDAILRAREDCRRQLVAW